MSTRRPPTLMPSPAGLPALAQLQLGPEQRLLAWTPAARQIVLANPASLALHQGRLQTHPDPAPLQAALRQLGAPGRATAPSPPDSVSWAIALHRPERLPLTLRLARPTADQAGEERTTLWLVDPEQLQLDEAALRQAFGFTPTEARVATAVAAGSTTAELAEAWGLRTNTVQMHVKRLLAKTHTTRQAQLVGLLWRTANLRLGVEAPAIAGIGVQPRSPLTQTGNDRPASPGQSPARLPGSGCAPPPAP